CRWHYKVYDFSCLFVLKVKEALRMALGVNVAHISSNRWAVSGAAYSSHSGDRWNMPDLASIKQRLIVSTSVCHHPVF
ncbi:MAG: hypothetical protein WCG35_10505, partial [Betaproteobacteria bacterium]